MKCRIICSVWSKSAITPLRSGLVATMSAGVRPSMRRASVPTARTWPVRLLTATTEGSLSTLPRPRTCTSVLAVPRSMPTSADQIPNTDVNRFKTGGKRWSRFVVGRVDDTPGGVLFHSFTPDVGSAHEDRGSDHQGQDDRRVRWDDPHVHSARDRRAAPVEGPPGRDHHRRERQGEPDEASDPGEVV